MRKEGFLYGALILAIVNFIVRILGFSYKIILSKLIGPEGIGLFQMVFPVLMIFITITTAGIPIAVSKLVAKQNSIGNQQGVKKVFRMSLLIVLLLAILLDIVIIIFGKFISWEILNNKDIYPSILTLAPAILIISLSSTVRGYFYGLKNITPAGIAQILEQIVRIGFVLGIIYYLYPVSPKLGAFIAVCGISVGELFGFLWLLVNYRLNKRNKKQNTTSHKISSIKALSSICYIAVPITISRIVNVTLHMINAILIPQRLMVAGYSNSDAIAIFGRVTGMTMPLIFLPFIVTSALVINIIPNLSEEMELKNYRLIKNNITLSIRITLIISIPLSFIYIFLGNPIAMFFYNDTLVGKYVEIMGYATLFLSLQHTLSGILHGLGKQVITTINYIIGMSFQVLAIYFLVGNPRFGINGFFIGFIISSILISLLHFITLKKILPIKLNIINSILKPLFSSLVSIVLTGITYKYFSNVYTGKLLPLLFSFSLGGISYFAILFLIKGLPPYLFRKIFNLKNK
ncbi:stage V sporulation protein B [Dethiothermospora halolimnae]|uniref:stage V sporulation protein B n=1 Tax=Dethiothermospora halolimnae TaxID=3114390 RepID=UPI003CCC2AA3